MYRPHNSYSMPKPYQTLNMPKKFPQDIECIVKSKTPGKGSLYISNIEAAQNINTLKKLQIGAVLSCAKGYELRHPSSVIPHYKYIPTVDHDECEISIHFDEAADFIQDKLVKTNVLVHCIAGVSRSVSMVLAYFIREHNMSYDEAYRLVKGRRKIISPNDGFIRQLKNYQIQRKSVTPNKIQESNSRSLPKQSYIIGRDRQAKAPIKANNYMEFGLQRNFKSTQLTSQPLQYRNGGNFIERYQSTDFATQKFIPNQYQTETSVRRTQRTDNYPLKRTSTAYLTPTKIQQELRHEPYLNNNQEHTKSTSDGKAENIMTNSRKYVDKDLNPSNSKEQSLRNGLYQINKNQDTQNITNDNGKRETKVGGYFSSMNNQLNQKIEMIRKKYQDERKKLYEKYQGPDRKIGLYNTQYQRKIEINQKIPRQQVHSAQKAKPQELYRSEEQILNQQNSPIKSYNNIRQYLNQYRQTSNDNYDDTYLRKLSPEGQFKQTKRSSNGYRRLDSNYNETQDWTVGKYRPYTKYNDFSYRNYNNYYPSYGYNYRRI